MLVAGGTGGHIFPAIAVAETCCANNEEVVLLTDRRGQRFVKTSIFSKIIVIPFLKIFLFFENRQSFFLFRMIHLSILPFASLLAILRIRPKVIWGFGGKLSLFPLIWAKILGIPCGIHQSDRILGRTNRFLSKIVDYVALSYEKTYKVPANIKPIITGTPVRDAFKKIPPLYIKENKNLHICILGGSQGANIWGNIVPQAISLLLPHEQKRLYIVHQCPQDQQSLVSSFYKKTHANFVLKSFITDMVEVLYNTHLVLSRAGASTLAELMTTGRPAFLVPYPFAMDEHQWWNAQWVVQNGAGWMCREEDLNLSKLAKFLQDVLHNPEKLMKVGKFMKALGANDASYAIYEIMQKTSTQKKCNICSSPIPEIKE